MKILLTSLLVLSLFSNFSCSKAAVPETGQAPALTREPYSPPVPAAPTVIPPIPPPSPVVPPRSDTSLPPISDMKSTWALEATPYFGLELDLGPSTLSAQGAIARGKVWFASPNARKVGDVDSIQAVLVRFTADPKFVEYNRLTWFLVVPPVMGLEIQGPPLPVLNRDTPIPYLWAADDFIMVDDETGEFWGSRLPAVGNTAPQLTVNQLDAVQKYADSFGWWAVWYRLKAYNGRPVPQSVIDALGV